MKCFIDLLCVVVRPQSTTELEPDVQDDRLSVWLTWGKNGPVLSSAEKALNISSSQTVER